MVTARITIERWHWWQKVRKRFLPSCVANYRRFFPSTRVVEMHCKIEGLNFILAKLISVYLESGPFGKSSCVYTYLTECFAGCVLASAEKP
jgi:hypothetical protein